MQADKIKYSFGLGGLRISEKEAILLAEIGLNEIPAATDFVEYTSEAYGMSQSGVWYTLKKLKKSGMLDFMEKGERYRPLTLTEGGMKVLRTNMMPRGGVSQGVNRVAEISM